MIKPIKNSIILDKKYILNVGITNERKDIILEYIINKIINTSEKFYIVTPNPEIITLAQKNHHFMDILNKAQVSLCDGTGLFLASKLLGVLLKERITGIDFMEDLCKTAAQNNTSLGFFGGKNGVAAKVASSLKDKYPGFNAKIITEEWSDDFNNIAIDILFVALGFPKQEEWMAANLNKTNAKIMMGVGGAFDYISGNTARASKLMRNLGLEWLYRLYRQPWRFKRQIIGSKFFYLVLKEKLKKH